MKENPNIVMLMLDTARAKDVYGNPSLENISAMAKYGLKYKNAVSPGTWTATSHASMFSARPVSKISHVSKSMFVNGTARIDPWFVKTKFLPNNAETIASKLYNLGYSNVLMSNNPFVNRLTNLAIGFNNVYDLWENTNLSKMTPFRKRALDILQKGKNARMWMMNTSYNFSRLIPSVLLDKLYLNLRIRLDKGVAEADKTYMLDRGASHTNKILSQHLKKSSDFRLPGFYFINYIEAHENYPVDDKEIIQDKWMYLSGIMDLDQSTLSKLHKGYLKRLKYLDKKVGEAIFIMKKDGLLDNTLLIITSDHGQFFGEHGLLYHSQFPYSGVSNVPLISTRFIDGKPLKEGKEIDTPVSLAKISNAICDFVKSNSQNLNGHMFGNAFSEHTGISEGWDEYLLRRLKDRSRYADMIYKAKAEHNKKAVAIYGEKFKLIHFYGKRKDELYSIEDSEEEYDMANERRAVSKALLESYEQYLKKTKYS